MSILGVGTDIISVPRIEKSWQRYGAKFGEQILHPNEMLALSAQTNPVAFLAKRFAAKEAVSKALGTGLAMGVTAANIEITHNDNGAPLVVLHGGALERLQQLGAKQCQLSISDEKAYAVAFAVLS